MVNREFVLGDEEREQFVEMMHCYEHFCGVRVLTYCVLSNHFHLLLAVPRRLLASILKIGMSDGEQAVASALS